MKKDWMVRESELDQYQIKALMAVLDKSCIVSGCAGSGKSVLALLKAQRLQNEKNTSNYQIIVYTKALCGYMNAGKKQLGLKGNFTYYWYWKNRDNMPSADYVIVDEIQDFNENEIRWFILSARKNFFFFGDTAQSIYDGYPEKGRTLPVDGIGYLCKPDQRPKEFPLYANYRLPVPVARIARYIGVDLDPYDESIYKSSENKKPKFIRCANIDTQIDFIFRTKNNDTALDDIAILVPNNEMVKTVHEKLITIGFNHEVKYSVKNPDGTNTWKDTLNFDTTNPKLMTYHSAKGLQFQTVFLLAVTQPTEPVQQKALYVAITRTYRDLYVLYSDELPAILARQELNGLYDTEESAQVENIKLNNNITWDDDLPF